MVSFSFLLMAIRSTCAGLSISMIRAAAISDKQPLMNMIRKSLEMYNYFLDLIFERSIT